MADTPELTTLASVVARTGGALQTGPFGSQLHASDYQSTGTPLVMPVNLGDNEIREGGIARIGATDVHRLRRHALRDGDIVFSRRGDVGRRSLVREKEVGWLCGTGCLAAKFGTDRRAVNPAYVAEYLGSNAAQTWLVDNAVGGTMLNLNTGILAALPVLLPPKHEQNRIVSAFGDVQQTIKTLERLIAKKQAIKQGMMQQLLTGRARLPGFTDDWRQSTVGAEFDVQLGKMLDAAKNAGVVKPYLGNRAVQWGRIDVSAAGSVPMTPSDIHRYRLQAGDLLVCEGGEVGRAAVWRNELSECYFQKALHRLRPRSGYDIRVMQALLELWSSVGSFADYVTQTSIAHLPREKFVEMPLPLPSIAEQTAIGDLVEDLDREIACVDRRIVKHRAIKQGMMQQLLTGRTRLPVEAAS